MDENTNIANNTILETLNLSSTPAKTSKKEELDILHCIFCDHSVENDFKTDNKAILQHMFIKHRVVIADVHDVSDLVSYLKFWKVEFKG